MNEQHMRVGELDELKCQVAACRRALRRQGWMVRLLLMALLMPLVIAATVSVQNADLLIDRTGFSISANNLIQGSCPQCREPAAGVWN